METIEVKTEQIEEYKKRSVEIEKDCSAYVIKTDQDAICASDFLKSIKQRIKQASDFFKPIVESAHAAHRIACDRRNLVLTPLEKGARILSDRVARYQYDQEKKRREEEERAAAAAKAKEEKERAKLVDKAVEAEEAGDVEKAEELVEKAEEHYVAPKPVAAPVQTKTAVRLTWIAEVVDQKLVPEKYKTVDIAKLQRIKRVDSEVKVPGIRFIEKPIGVTR